MSNGIFSQVMIDEIEDFGLGESFSDSGPSFVAIDFETATRNGNSICQVGIANVEKGEIVSTSVYLVQPPGNEYEQRNISIHGITPDDTADCEDFAAQWRLICDNMECKIAVTHNSSFDMTVLRKTLDYYQLDYPAMPFFCSLQLARKVITECMNYQLPTLCETLGIPFEHHHNAKADAVACAEVFLECLRRSGVSSFVELMEKYRFTFGQFYDPSFFRPLRSVASVSAGTSAKDIVGDPDKVDVDSYFYGKHICFTGTLSLCSRSELQQIIADIGGRPQDGVNLDTQILVVGQQDMKRVDTTGLSGKHKKALSIKKKDPTHDIEIMSEADFMSNLTLE